MKDNPVKQYSYDLVCLQTEQLPFEQLVVDSVYKL